MTGHLTTVWTQNLGTAHRMASAIGREGGVHSLEFYTELRNVMIER